MINFMKKYIQFMDSFTNKVGILAMYLIFVMIIVLFYSSISKTFFTPSYWTLEIAQFLMMTYFVLGGGYSLKEDSHVRMDLLYDRLSERGRNIMDSIVMVCLLTYLIILLWGGIDSMLYALKYGERSYSSWRPYMAPIKIILNIGIFLTILQAVAIWFKNILKAKGVDALSSKK